MKELAERMIQEALRSVDPYYLIQEQIILSDDRLIIQNKAEIDLSSLKNIYLIGAGKGTAPMATAMEELLGSFLTEGAITVKYGHGQKLQKVTVLEAGHPIPDKNTLDHTKRLLEIADKADKNDLVIVLFTGGGSALMESLPEEINLDHLAEMNQLLLSSGATIGEINTIRKHISLTKGGRLAKRIAPAKTLSLILSDVIGDPLQSIASGPTAPDSTTFKQAIDILNKFKLNDRIPNSIADYLQSGLDDKIDETPKPTDDLFKVVENFVIGNNVLALKRIKTIAKEAGFQTLLLTDRAEGEAKEIAKLLAGIIKSCINSSFPISSPGCLILGGEPTVTLSGNGKGGRNQEITLAMLDALSDIKEEFYFCSVGSDGTDGPTDAAGAWIDDKTMSKVLPKKLSIQNYLDKNDSYHFFKGIEQLIISGPTRTNVMDFIFCLF